MTTSAGVHALPLAEFAALGILNGFKRSAELAQDQAAKVWPELRTPTRLVNGSPWWSPDWARSAWKRHGSPGHWA